MLKWTTCIIFFISANCFAVQIPSDALQLQYQKSIEPKYKRSNDFKFNLSSVFQIPEATYRYLDDTFAAFYKKLTFKTSIADSTFADNSYYKLISLPLIATNEQGLQMELFGNFSDLSKQYLSNLSADQPLHDYLANSEQIDFYDSSLSLGAGISFNTGQSSKIKFIISNHEMPGYGDSQALLGFEKRF